MPFYLMIEGFIGSSTDPRYPNGIEVLSYSWGPDQLGGYGAGGSAPKSDVRDLFFTKTKDNASAKLLGYASGRSQIDKAVLVAVNSGATVSNPPSASGWYSSPRDDAPRNHDYRVTLTGIVVESVQYQGSGDDPLEGIAFSFGNARTVYGPEPSPFTTVQPDHQHLINHLKYLRGGQLRKPGS